MYPPLRSLPYYRYCRLWTDLWNHAYFKLACITIKAQVTLARLRCSKIGAVRLSICIRPGVTPTHPVPALWVPPLTSSTGEGHFGSCGLVANTMLRSLCVSHGQQAMHAPHPHHEWPGANPGTSGDQNRYGELRSFAAITYATYAYHRCMGAWGGIDRYRSTDTHSRIGTLVQMDG